LRGSKVPLAGRNRALLLNRVTVQSATQRKMQKKPGSPIAVDLSALQQLLQCAKKKPPEGGLQNRSDEKVRRSETPFPPSS
jgi:hypothetical protein